MPKAVLLLVLVLLLPRPAVAEPASVAPVAHDVRIAGAVLVGLGSTLQASLLAMSLHHLSLTHSYSMEEHRWKLQMANHAAVPVLVLGYGILAGEDTVAGRHRAAAIGFFHSGGHTLLALFLGAACDDWTRRHRASGKYPRDIMYIPKEPIIVASVNGVAGAVYLTLGVALLVRAAWRDEVLPDLALHPWASAESAGLSVNGRF